MEPRYYDAEGQIDYPEIKAYAGELRLEAMNAFWSGVLPAAQALLARLRRSTAGHTGGSPAHAVTAVRAAGGATKSR